MGFWKDPKRKDWIYRFQFNGKNYGSRGYKTKAAARAAREDHRQRLKSESIQETGVTDFKSVAYAYLDESKRRHAIKTYKTKRRVFKSFVKFADNLPINRIDANIIDAYLKTRPSNNNFNVNRTELHSLFTFAKKRLKVVDFNPVGEIDPMPHTPARKRIPTETQLLELIMAADPDLERPLLMFVLLTLARVDEALRLTWQDVNFEKKTVTLWTRKRKGGALQPDDIPMNGDLYDVLWRLWQTKKQNKWVFFNEKTGTRYNSRPKFMKGLCKRAFAPELKKVKDYQGPVFGFHSLRHFMASYLADKKKRSTKTMQKILRHKEQRTTEIYLHSVDESVRSAMNAIEGEFSAELDSNIRFSSE